MGIMRIAWLTNIWRISELSRLFRKLANDARGYGHGLRRQRNRLQRNSALMWIAESLEQRELLSVVTVTTTSDTSNDGDTTSIKALHAHPGSDGKISLREAILASNNTGGANTIMFDPQLTQRRDVNISPRQVGDVTAGNSAFAITSTLTIIGATDRDVVKLKGTGLKGDLRLFRVLAGGNLTLQGLTMINWRTDTNGGVLTVDPFATVTINNCVLANNVALSQGGAIFNSGFLQDSEVDVTLTNCTLSGNRAHDGGAYSAGNKTWGGYTVFLNCILEGNTAVDRGGAIALYNAGVVMTDCRLVNNSAHQGGAIAGGDIRLYHSTLIGNTAIDGGGIFTGIGGGVTGGNIVQVGGPGGISRLELDNCTLTGNSAQHRGGGLYVVLSFFSLANSTFSGNHAQQGGGIYLDTSELQFLTQRVQRGSGNVFSSNSATATGGAIFVNNGGMGITGRFTNNVAQQGAALFNNLGNVRVTNSTVVNNRSQRGTQLFNHLGILSLTNSTVSDIARMAFLPTADTAGTQFAAMNPGLEPSAITPPLKSTIVTAPGGIRYALNPNRVLLRQFPGCNWSVLDDLVQSFKIAPNGDCVWLNDRGDLLLSRAGAAGDLIGTLVQSFAMDKYGTVYDLSNGFGPGNFALYRSLTAPLLDPVDIIDDSDHFCLIPPTAGEVLQAAGLLGAAILNPRVVVEPLVERLNEITYFPNIGLARMHHCHYKCTVYYSTELNGDLTAVIYIDNDHLVREVPGETVSRPSASHHRSAAAAIMASTIATVSDANRSDNIRSLWTGPDGTIYKLGGEYNGQHLIGQPPFPLVLWRLPFGGNWEPLLRVLAAEVAPDNTLFVLNTKHELQRLVPGAKAWTTVAHGVQSFKMIKNGTIYALDASSRLLQVQQPRHSTRWIVSTLDTGIRSFAVTADGAVYDLNDRNELRKLNERSRKFVRFQSGVSSLQQAADGTIYAFHQSGQLKRLEDTGRWSTLGSGIQSFQLDLDGVLYVLNRGHELRRMTAGGHWSLVDVDVQSFLLAPNGLRNVYILTTHHELKRLEAGYSWRTLRTDAVSMSIDQDGVVTALDTKGRSWLYWSPITVPVLDPVDGLVFCVDPPTRDDILRLTHIADGPNVEAAIELTVDEIDPSRWLPSLGNIPPVRPHHCHWRGTVMYQTAQGLKTVVIEIDFDTLIRAGGPTIG